MDEQSKKLEKSKKNESLYYISPKEFTEAIREYYKYSDLCDSLEKDDNSKEAKKIRKTTEKLLNRCGLYLKMTVEGLSKRANWAGYTWKEDMISDALLKCVKALVRHKFDVTKGYNPLSYFDKVASREFGHRIKLEKKIVKTKNDYIDEHYKNFAEDSETPIYVKKRFMEDFDTMWDPE